MSYSEGEFNAQVEYLRGLIQKERERAEKAEALIPNAAQGAAMIAALREAERFMAYFAGETNGVFVGPGTPQSCLAHIRYAIAPHPPVAPVEECPRPVIPDHSVKACVESGNCGCDHNGCSAGTADVRQKAENAIRTFCQSLGTGSVSISSDGVERIYYAGINLKALSVSVALAIRDLPQEVPVQQIEKLIYENASISHYGNESEVDNAAYLAREIASLLSRPEQK